MSEVLTIGDEDVQYEGIAEKILALYENPALREKLGIAGRNIVLEKYSKKGVSNMTWTEL